MKRGVLNVVDGGERTGKKLSGGEKIREAPLLQSWTLGFLKGG